LRYIKTAHAVRSGQAQVAVGNENALAHSYLRHQGGLALGTRKSELSKSLDASETRSTRSDAQAARELVLRRGVWRPHSRPYPKAISKALPILYSEIAHSIRAARRNKKRDKAVLFPTVEDGVKGLAFMRNVPVASSQKNGRWMKLEILKNVNTPGSEIGTGKNQNGEAIS